MKTLIVNAQVFDGSGTPPSRADVLIDGNRIVRVAGRIEAPRGEEVRVIDAAGATLMPGLIDGHTHLGLGSTVEHASTRSEPEEEQALIISHNARVMLDHGYTSAYSGGNRRPRVEVALRKAIREGWMPGPRLLAASWEISAGTMGKKPPTSLKPKPLEGHIGAADRAPITGQLRDFVNEMADIGVDIIKLPITGESALVEYTSKILEFKEEEVAAVSEVARERGLWLTAHAHSSEGIQMAIRHGFRVIYHITYMDDETIEMALEAKRPVFLNPCPASLWVLQNMGFPTTPGQEVDKAVESLCRLVPKLVKAGLPVILGGDYGFAVGPVGLNAKDLELYVDWFGMTPAQVLRCGMEVGGQLMGMGDELGLVREGYLADLLLVEGDPTKDVKIMQNKSNLSMIMQDGRFYKLDGQRRPAVIREPMAA